MEMMQETPVWQSVFAILAGLALLLAGYRLMRVSMRVFGALFLGMAGFLLGSSYGWPTFATVSVCLGLGVLGFLVVGDALYYLFVILYGAAGGFALAALGCTVVGLDQVNAVAAVSGVVAGVILALFLERPFYIISLSALGSITAVAGIGGIFIDSGLHGSGDFVWAYVLLMVIVFILGAYVQFVTTRKLPEIPESESRKQVGNGEM